MAVSKPSRLRAGWLAKPRSLLRLEARQRYSRKTRFHKAEVAWEDMDPRTGCCYPASCRNGMSCHGARAGIGNGAKSPMEYPQPKSGLRETEPEVGCQEKSSTRVKVQAVVLPPLK